MGEYISIYFFLWSQKKNWRGSKIFFCWGYNFLFLFFGGIKKFRRYNSFYYHYHYHGLSLKMECHSKWNVTQNGMSLQWNVTQNEITLQMECH